MCLDRHVLSVCYKMISSSCMWYYIDTKVWGVFLHLNSSKDFEPSPQCFGSWRKNHREGKTAGHHGSDRRTQKVLKSGCVSVVTPPQTELQCVSAHIIIKKGGQTYLCPLRPALLGVASLLRGVLPLLISASASNTSSSRGSTPSKSLDEQQQAL